MTDRCNMVAVTAEVEKALDTPTLIDADELGKACRDERWREFCLNAERYVAETTRCGSNLGRSA